MDTSTNNIKRRKNNQQYPAMSVSRKRPMDNEPHLYTEDVTNNKRARLGSLTNKMSSINIEGQPTQHHGLYNIPQIHNNTTDLEGLNILALLERMAEQKGNTDCQDRVAGLLQKRFEIAAQIDSNRSC